MKQILILIGFISIGFCQDPSQNPKLGKTFGTNTGVFFNAGTDQIDFDAFFKLQSVNGFFGEIWVSELDLDNETTIEVNSTFGWMKEVAPDLTLAGGISNNTELNGERLNEFFIGGNISLFTGLAFFGIDNTPSNFIGIFDLNFGPLKNIPVDLSMMSVSDEAGSDLFFMLKKTTTKGFIAGYTFSRERFESEETRTFTKQGHTKSWTVPVQQDGFFNTIYIGVTF